MKYFMLVMLALTGSNLIAQADDKTTSVRVMCYNIHHASNTSGITTLKEQAAAILAGSPDFVGLQEVDNQCTRSGSIDQAMELSVTTEMRAAYVPHFPYQGGTYGLALLSRHPLSDIQNDRISVNVKGTTETRALLSATATLDDGTTMVVATVHMALDQQSRLVQAQQILSCLGSKGVPTILTGDFNAEPGTPEIALLEKDFVNVGSTTTPTFSATAPVKTIDYIMVDRESLVRVVHYKVLSEVHHSDHLPLVADVVIKTKQ